MKLLVLTSSYPRHPGDHAGSFVHAMNHHLRARGHLVHTIAPADNPPHPHDDPHTTRFHYTPNLLNLRKNLQRLFYGAGTPENLRAHPALAATIPPALASFTLAALKRCLIERPDRIIAHWLLPAGLVAHLVSSLLLLIKPQKIPVRHIAHSGDVHTLKKLPRWLTRALTTHTPTAAVSAPLTSTLHQLGCPHATCLPMGFDADLTYTPRPHDARDWLWMGRLVPIKVPQDAMRAFALFARQLTSPPTLHIAGDGPLRRDLHQLAASLDAPIKLHGFVSGEAKRRLLMRCALSLWSSTILDDGRHEGTPVSLLECCAAGLIPAIAQVPGADWLLEDPTTQTLPNRDLHVWSQRMLALHHLDDLRPLALATSRRVEHLRWPDLIQRWETFLR